MPNPLQVRLSRTFTAFASRDFRLLWAGAFTSSVGTWMQSVAQNWLVLTMTGSPLLLGVNAFLGDVPFLLFSLFGGVLADRMDRRRILLGSQLVQMSSAFFLAALLLRGEATVWIILALAFVVGFAQSFGGPAFQSLLPTLVPKEALTNAVAMNSIQFNLARVVGPALAGWCFAQFGAAACMGLNGVSFFAVIAALLVIRSPQVAGPSREPVLDSLKAGVSTVRRSRVLRQLVLLAFSGSFLSMPLVTFLPVLAKDVFGLEAKGYSRLLTAFGLGAVAGALGIAGSANVKRKGALALSLMAAFGALTLGVAFSRSLLLTHVFLFGAGASLMIVFAMFMTLVQSSVDDALRGRVVSIYVLAFRGAMPVGNLVAGLLTKVAPATWVLAGNGLLLLTLSAAVLFARGKDGVVAIET